MTAAPRRRTQKERREGTIRKLIDAATDTLIDVGYAEASVQRICERAELSQGALFRHFPTAEALFIAAGEDVGARLLGAYEAKFKKLRRGDPEADVAQAIKLLREACRSRLNQAWYELAIAARTNTALRKALEPVAKKYYSDIAALAAELMPDVAKLLGDAFPVLVRTVTSVFDGELVQRLGGKSAKDDDTQLQLLSGVVAGLTASSSGR